MAREDYYSDVTSNNVELRTILDCPLNSVLISNTLPVIGEPLVKFAAKELIAGSGIGLSIDGSTITFSATGSGPSVSGSQAQVPYFDSNGNLTGTNNLTFDTPQCSMPVLTVNGNINAYGATFNNTVNVPSLYATYQINAGYYTGTWNGDAIATGYGGTGLTTYSKGDILIGNDLGGLSKLSNQMIVDSVATTNNTQTTISTIAIPLATARPFVIHCTGYDSTGHNAYTSKIEGLIKNVSGTASIVNSATVTYNDTGASSWSISATVSSGNLLIKVTGATSTNISWNCSTTLY